MVIQTNEGQIIECCGSSPVPEWSGFHNLYYVTGHRLVKSRNQFSKNILIHSFKEWKVIEN